MVNIKTSHKGTLTKTHISLCTTDNTTDGFFMLISAVIAFSCCLQCFNAVGWAAGRASGL